MGEEGRAERNVTATVLATLAWHKPILVGRSSSRALGDQLDQPGYSAVAGGEQTLAPRGPRLGNVRQGRHPTGDRPHAQPRVGGRDLFRPQDNRAAGAITVRGRDEQPQRAAARHKGGQAVRRRPVTSRIDG